MVDWYFLIPSLKHVRKIRPQFLIIRADKQVHRQTDKRSLMPIVHTADTDKTRLSCLVGVRSVNWIGDKSRPSANFETVLSSLDWVKNSSQMRSHRRPDWTKLFSLQFWFEDYWKLSATVANSVLTVDADRPTRRDSFVLSVSAVWTIGIRVHSVEQLAICSALSVNTSGCGWLTYLLTYL